MRVFSLIVICAASMTAGLARGADSATTFNKDVAPIVFNHCTACHRPNNIGPFSLVTFQDAKKRAKQLARITEKRIMPPWLPSGEWAEFKHARTLTEAQVAVFASWVQDGALEGDATDLPPLPKFHDGWHFGPPDMILKMERPFDVPAEGRDIYHHFVFPLNFEKDRYLKGIEIMPGNRRVAHHAVGILDASGTARRLAREHDGIGYPGNAPGFLPVGFTPGYAPGQEGALFGPGEAITLKKGTDYVLQMHYSPSGKEEIDQTSVGLYFTDTPPKRNVSIILMGAVDIDIPPGEKVYRKSDYFTLPVDYEVGNIWAHMHLIGRTAKVWAELPDKKTARLLKIDDWNFNWQDTYFYAEPIVLPKGTIIRAEFTWDNSAENPRNPSSPPARVLNGEQSSDEMAGIIIGGRPVSAADETKSWAAVVGHYLGIESRNTRRAK